MASLDQIQVSGQTYTIFGDIFLRKGNQIEVNKKEMRIDGQRIGQVGKEGLSTITQEAMVTRLLNKIEVCIRLSESRAEVSSDVKRMCEMDSREHYYSPDQFQTCTGRMVRIEE